MDVALVFQAVFPAHKPLIAYGLKKFFIMLSNTETKSLKADVPRRKFFSNDLFANVRLLLNNAS